MPKIVLIDIDNTLLDFNKCAYIAMQSAAVERSVELPAETFSVYRRVNSLLWRKLELGEISREDIFDNRWDLIFDELSVSHDGKAFEKVYEKYLYDAAAVVKGARQLLEYLSAKYVVCAASNGSYRQQCNRLKNAGLLQYLKAVYTSDIIGAQKPSKAFYRECMRKASCFLPEESDPVWPGDTVMIGDSLTADIADNGKWGLDTIWFDYDGIKDTIKDTKKDPRCKVVSELMEIAEIL